MKMTDVYRTILALWRNNNGVMPTTQEVANVMTANRKAVDRYVQKLRNEGYFVPDSTAKETCRAYKPGKVIVSQITTDPTIIDDPAYLFLMREQCPLGANHYYLDHDGQVIKVEIRYEN